MELVRGGQPITTYAKDYALSWQERLAVFVRVCHAVRYAHEHRVVHRDLKPANILVDSDGRPVVIDFGLAQACDALLPGAHIAASGTPAYMSPEQMSDAFGPISAKSDTYALGLILYELLTGQHPYILLRNGSIELLRRVITEATPPPLSQYDKAYRGELDAILTVALAKQPADRAPVAVLRSRIERYLNKLPSEIDRPKKSTSPQRTRKRPKGKQAEKTPLREGKEGEPSLEAVTVPWPPEMRITPPSAELPPEVAAFSGVWEGAWEGVLKSRLAVEKIDGQSARGLYAWADHPHGLFTGGWVRFKATVLPPGKLQWGTPWRGSEIKFTFAMAKDQMSIEGEREEGGNLAIVFMKKV
jgi:serine/threonine protein kinase